MPKGECALTALSDRLLWARKRAGLTQMQLAKKSGVSQGAISDFETGRTEAGYSDTLFKLAAALEVNINWLADGVGQPHDLADHDRASLHDMIDDMTPEQVTIARGLMQVITKNAK